MTEPMQIDSLCYFYIFQFRSIKGLGISLDPRLIYEMNETDKLLTVRVNPEYVEGVWPEGLSSLTALVGNNGTGKTSFLEYMTDTVSDRDRADVHAIFVFKNKGELYAYVPKECGYKVHNEYDATLPKVHVVTKRPKESVFYFSSYFRPFKSVINTGDGEMGSVYNGSDTWRLIKELTTYTNRSALLTNVDIGSHLASLRIQDDNRIVQLIADKELRDCLPANVLPKYILIKPNYSGREWLMKEDKTTIKGEQRYIVPSFGATKDGYLAKMVYMDFYNKAAENNGFLKGESIQYQNLWLEFFMKSRDVLRSLSEMSDVPDWLIGFVAEIRKIAYYLYDVCTYDEKCDVLYIDASEDENKSKVEQIIYYFKNCDYVMGQHFDLAYTRDVQSDMQMSSGETDMLKLFSRLYDALELYPGRYSNIESSQLILLDEAENSYHPEWQRKFIYMLVRFVNALYMRTDQKRKFQIVLTTHSPILLSDIPSICVNYLQRDKEGKVHVLKDSKETFGANIFNLYRDSFFLSNGLIGEYAQKKISELERGIKKGTISTQNAMQKINLIGEDAIKEYLIALLERYQSKDMLAYYQQKVKELGGE